MPCVLLLKKICQQYPILFISVQCSLPCFPFVISGTVYTHELAQKGYGIFPFELFEHFVFFSLPVTYSLFAPTPSTQYPFFNRSFSISSFATISRNCSISDRLLLTCSAANLLPGCLCGMNADSPSAIYSFTHRQIILLSASYSFPNLTTDTWSSKCLRTISVFCSGVHIRLICPFFISSTPICILA